MKELIKRALRFFAAREWSVFFILCLEIFVFYLLLYPDVPGRSHTFLNLENFGLILKYSSTYGIAAVGAAMIIICGGIDLAPGSIIALTAVISGYLYIDAGWPLLLSCAAGLLVGTVSGLTAAFLITNIKLPPFIATLGVMGIGRGLAYIIMENKTYIDLSARFNISHYSFHLPLSLGDALRKALPDSWVEGMLSGIPLDVFMPTLSMLVLALFFHWFMVRTRWGRQIHAVGGNETAAYFSGVKVGRMKTVVYLVGGVLSSVAGIMLAVAHGQARQDLASGYELDIIAAAVVGGASLTGGKGSVLGAVIGALIFGVLSNALKQIPGAAIYERFLVGLAVVIIVIIDQLAVRRQRKAGS